MYRFFGFLIIIVSGLLNSCSVFNIEVEKVDEIKIGEVGDKDVQIEVYIWIRNDAPVSIKLKDVNATVELNDTPFGKIIPSEDFVIPAKSNEKYLFYTRIDYSQFLMCAFSMFKSIKSKKIDYRITGTMKVKAFFFWHEVDLSKNGEVKFTPNQ